MTLLKRAFVCGMLGIAAPVLLAQQSDVKPSSLKPAIAPAPAGDVTPVYGQIARRPIPKQAFVRKPSGESQLMVKFTDSAHMRLQQQQQGDQGMRVAPAIAGVNTTALDQIVGQYNLTFRTAFPYVTEQELQDLENRAAIYSNKAQPDLAGFVFVDGAAGVIQQAANALNALDIVEFAYFHAPWHPYDIPTPPAPRPQNDAPAKADDGGIAGPPPPPCNNCGDLGCLDCFTVHMGPYCTVPIGDGTCCTIVGDIRPFCNDADVGGTWDLLCVAIANLFCPCPDTDGDGNPDCDTPPPPGAPDRCASPINGSCFEAHSTGGCVDSTCCATVCAIDPFCCDNVWDGSCVALANLNCNGGGSGATPDLTAYQGYLRRTSYADQPGGVPTPLGPPAPDWPNFGGEGLWLFDDAYLTDHPGAPVPQRYNGIYGLGRQLLEQYHIGPYNMTRGRGVKVAVIEWAFYSGHEDLNVISEPGQTLILIPEVTHPDHATACLGIINAQINGIGMDGIAPDAQAYFFPLTSVEQGPREFAAWTHMMQTLGPGDVVSNSYGPGGGNLNTDAGAAVLITMATDLGISVCIAAGNDCVNLDDATDNGDTGGTVVGAATPGRLYARLTFSNFYKIGDPSTSGNVVHVSSWGESVPSLGGSANLRFPGNNWNRSYCNNFNGTSAATPQVAGVTACLQGLARQFYGITLQPRQIRAAIAATGFPQLGIPNPDMLPGFPDVLPCGPDLDPDAGPNKIGPYPRPERAGAFILNQWSVGFNEAPFVDDVTIIRGLLVYGNKFSIKGSDNNYLVVQTQYTPRKHRPNLPGPAGRVTYLGSGQIADIMVTGHTDTISNNVQIDYEYSPPGGVSFLVTEAYDYTTKKWVTLNFEVTPTVVPGVPNPDVLGLTLATSAQRFINPAAANTIYIRQYLMGIGGNGSPALTMRWDLINLTLMQGPGGGGTTGGGP